jgi:hypothetical protein
MLTVTTPATDRSLLTLTELRAAAGVTDGSRDAKLILLGNGIAALMAQACQIPSSGIIPPTFRLETITETFRSDGNLESAILSRQPVASITSLSEAGTALVADDYENTAGILRRLSGGRLYPWSYGDLSVVYTAGWATVPDDLKLAATKFVQAEIQSDGRDPMLKRKSTEGVSEYEWWVDPTKDSIVPAEVMDILERGGYVQHWL